MYRPCRPLTPNRARGDGQRLIVYKVSFAAGGVSIPNFQEWVRVMNPVESEHEILTMKELRYLLHAHQATIYKILKRGKIPSFRIGSEWRFRRRD
jgi:excisionase family DNA binding protein